MTIIKSAQTFGYNECGDTTIRVDCYEKELITRALRYYAAILVVEHEQQLAIARSANDAGAPDAMNDPDIWGAEEWLARCRILRDEADIVLR